MNRQELTIDNLVRAQHIAYREGRDMTEDEFRHHAKIRGLGWLFQNSAKRVVRDFSNGGDGYMVIALYGTDVFRMDVKRPVKYLFPEAEYFLSMNEPEDASSDLLDRMSRIERSLVEEGFPVVYK